MRVHRTSKSPSTTTRHLVQQSRDYLPHSPETVHDFVGLTRVGLAMLTKTVVSFRRQREARDLEEVHLERVVVRRVGIAERAFVA